MSTTELGLETAAQQYAGEEAGADRNRQGLIRMRANRLIRIFGSARDLASRAFIELGETGLRRLQAFVQRVDRTGRPRARRVVTKNFFRLNDEGTEFVQDILRSLGGYFRLGFHGMAFLIFRSD